MMILFTSANVASANMARKLIEEHGFEKADGGSPQAGGMARMEEWRSGAVRLMDTKAPSVLEVPADMDADYAIVLSTHRSKIREKVMTAHLPGNWDSAEMGGSPRTLNTAPASRLKFLIQEIGREAGRIGWKATLEADHHGPTGKTPMIFAEIGSTEEEWKDEEAAGAMARAVMAGIRREGTREAFFGVGGGHYPKDFTRIDMEGDLACGHIAPKYAIDRMDYAMFRQGIERNVEKVSKVLVVKDETNSAQKSKIEGFAATAGVGFELI